MKKKKDPFIYPQTVMQSHNLKYFGKRTFDEPLTYSKPWHYKPPTMPVFIGDGDIKRLNPRLAWDEIPEDIKSIIQAEESKHREIEIIPPPNASLHTLWIYGPCTEWEEEQIKIVHDDLQETIEAIERMENADD